MRETKEEVQDDRQLPSLASSLVAPIVTIILLALRPVADIAIDPLIALPIGGLCGLLCMRQWKNLLPCMEYGLQKMSSVAILLVVTGTIAGIIKNSTLKDWILNLLAQAHFDEVMIAPVSGVTDVSRHRFYYRRKYSCIRLFCRNHISSRDFRCMGSCNDKFRSNCTGSFAPWLFFHATGGVCELTFKERLKLIPYETLIGAVLAASTTLLCLLC